MQTIRRIFSHSRSNLKTNDRENLKYVDLAPIDDADRAGIYTDALNYATNNPNISNIALTGPYGSGKSSIIRTFLKTYKRPVLQISLAAFLPDTEAKSGDNVENSEVSQQAIERSILQQMLYGADANSLPLSRFKRIKTPKWWSLFIPLIVILGTVSCIHVFNHRAEILTGAFFLPLKSSNWVNLTSISFSVIFVWIVLYQIYLKSFGLSLKSISLKNVDLAKDASDKESILNKHLDEIIYFFQSTKYDLVVVEDLDRFNNPDIFVSLREINSLINANAGVKRPIRFLYALRDNMFASTERTKFFEFIIPVIPIINSSNSIDKMIEHGERLLLDERLDRQFLREVSRYLNDLRLIQNIFNEYQIYVSNLETDDKNILDANKLLAIIIYKNVLPSDFEALHREKGKLAEILKQHDALIVQTETAKKAELLSLERQIEDAESEHSNNLLELQMIYAMAIISKAPAGYGQFEFSGEIHSPSTILNHPNFKDFVLSKGLTFRTNQGHRKQIDVSTVQNEVNQQKSYEERTRLLENKSTEFKSAAALKARRLRREISEIRLSKFNEIIRENAQKTEALFEAFDENRELVRFLVFEGYLDDTYYQYTSLFHSGRLSPSDNSFLIQIRSFTNPEPNFQLDNPKEVIASMRDDDFRQNFVLNKKLVDCLFENSGEYENQIAKLIGFISSRFDECEDFFSTYFESGKYVTELLSSLVAEWPDFVTTILDCSEDTLHLAHLIANLPVNILPELTQQDQRTSEVLSTKLSNILAHGTLITPERLSMLKFELHELKSVQDYPTLAQLIIDNGWYIVSIENIDFIFKIALSSAYSAELHSRHYSTVLDHGNQSLIDKVEDEFDSYLNNVLLALAENTEESVAAIVAALQHDNVSAEPLEEFVKKQTVKLPSLTDVPSRFHSMLFRQQKIEATWENCLAYMSSDNFEELTLTEYLQTKDAVRALSQITIDGENSSFTLRNFVIRNNELDDSTYRAYIKRLPSKFQTFPDGLDWSKYLILIEEYRVEFTGTNFNFLEENENLQIRFLTADIDSYLAQKDEITLDDNFREKLLKTDIGDDHKLLIIDDMDLSSLHTNTSRAKILGNIFARTTSDLGFLNGDAASAIVKNSGPITTQISLFNRVFQCMSDDQISNTLQALPYPFSDIKKGYYRPSIPDNAQNRTFAEWLEKRKIISSSKPDFFNKIRINNFRK